MKIPALTKEQVAQVLGDPIPADAFEDAGMVYPEVCEVCDGTGWFLIKNIFGEGLYSIPCPECGDEL